MADSIIRLILQAVNNAGGDIRSVTGDIKKQKDEIKQLQGRTPETLLRWSSMRLIANFNKSKRATLSHISK